MTRRDPTNCLAVYEARLEIDAIAVLPWETTSPVAAHVTAEGIYV